MPSKDITAIVGELKEKFSGIEVDDKLTVTVPVDDLLAFMGELKDNPEYDFIFLTNVTAVDYPDNFTVVYNLISFSYGYTLMVKVKVEDKEEPSVPSLTPLWGGANWQERETYDLFGIKFTGHPYLKRILLDDAFTGYPLRKDFEWEGGRQ